MGQEKNNLFDPRFGKRPARYIGRDDILRDIRAMLDDPDEEARVTIISGIKGSGKTAMLSEIRAFLDPSQAVFLSADSIDAGSAERSSAIHTAPTVYFADDVDKTTHGLAAFLDEFYEDKSSRLIMAGHPHAIEELLKDKNLSKLKSSFRVPLVNIRTDEVLFLFEDIFMGAETEDEEKTLDALKRAAEATMGYPYLIQLIGYYLSKEEKAIDDKAVDRAIFRAKIELYKNIHEPLVWSLSSKDRIFLWAMAQDESASEFGEIAKRMDVSTGYASKYRERLIGVDVIYSSAYGELAFTLPYMKEYIEKEYVERLGGEGGKRRL